MISVKKVNFKKMMGRHLEPPSLQKALVLSEIIVLLSLLVSEGKSGNVL